MDVPVAGAIKQQPQPPYAGDDNDSHMPKRIRTANGTANNGHGKSNESPAVYSEQVKKKLAAASRTGQACDRCKERKMKCDTDPVACQPCRSKHLRCFTTDRVTGQARERGQSDRTENELAYLQTQLHLYQQKYGPLTSSSSSSSPPPPPPPSIPSSRYVGWPVPAAAIEPGPVHGTLVNIVDAVVDVADFQCEQMREPRADEADLLNASRTSISRSVFHFHTVGRPDFPPLAEAMHTVDLFCVSVTPFAPIVHKPSFKAMVTRYYDQPDSVSHAELMQLATVLAIWSLQSANQAPARWKELYRKSHAFAHFALSLYGHVYADSSLEAMQALAMLCLYFRTLPRPGETRPFSHQVLLRLYELQYHRDPGRIALPVAEDNALGKELRMRVFHFLLNLCATTGYRVGRPFPWQFRELDVPLPTALLDDDISAAGLSSPPSGRSGQCDFLPFLQLCKLLPLYAELHDNVTAVRRPPAEYLRTVDALNAKIVAWRHEWDVAVQRDGRGGAQADVASFLVDHWLAEFQVLLHHPACCTSTAPDVVDRQLDVCHAATKKLLQSFHYLNREYRGVDYTCDSLTTYTAAFGLVLHVCRRRLARPLTRDRFESMRNELNGWLSLVAHFDLVLRAGHGLQTLFRARVQHLEDDYRRMVDKPPTATVVVPSPLPSWPQQQQQPQPPQPVSSLSYTTVPAASAHVYAPYSQAEAEVAAAAAAAAQAHQAHQAQAQAQQVHALPLPYPGQGAPGPPMQAPVPAAPVPISLAPILNNPSPGPAGTSNAAAAVAATSASTTTAAAATSGLYAPPYLAPAP